ncbi:hypothetical protein HYDPIDRAFT_33993 [Hydnomerulius pinastri MD-312]|uniref:Uncharacterized protein n=1 Tax=Hydnomerulius pinastri MD-312 TaxID=994086 RepID=A0A0C9VLY4_9AGAM|nr:hypothetical protein HYDPIDRAFT_33993 [Hydnomerulius pinastri MD-312]
MLSEASIDDPRPRGEPQSPRSVIAHHQHPHHAQALSGQHDLVRHTSTPIVGPLDQPGELRTYQTYIFAPPATGTPTKKGKPGSSAGIVNGSPLPTPPTTPSTAAPPPTLTAHILAPAPAPAPTPTSLYRSQTPLVSGSAVNVV